MAYYVKSSDGRTHFTIDKGMLIIHDQWGKKTYNANDAETLSGLLLSCSEEISQFAEHERSGKKVTLKQQLEDEEVDEEEELLYAEGIEIGEA
jgi:hypothetical protein